MKEKIFSLVMIVCLVFTVVSGLNYALSRFDPPAKNTQWIEYTSSKDMYVSQVAGELSNKLKRSPDTLVRVISEKNNLKDYFLAKGTTILVPNPI